jgi:hypothetical protein
MINKNDPLITAVQKIMQSNQAERDAVNAVNEKFGVVDRKVLPRERQNEWDAAYKTILSEAVDPSQYSEKQRKLAATAGDKEEIDGPDLHHVRKHGGKHIEEKAPPGREDQVKALKKKFTKGSSSPFKIAWESYKKKKKLDEDFNSRHGLSENASAEEQVVAEQTNRMPVSGEKNSSWFSKKTDMQRATSDLSKMARLRKMKSSGTPLDKNRNAELDKPGLEKAGVAQALKDPKAREVLDQTVKDAAKVAVPAALTGGPVGRTVAGGLKTAYNFVRNRVQSQAQTGNLAAGAARRPTNQSVPQVTATAGSATGRFPAGGPFGNIARRGGDARASAGRQQTSAATRDTFQGKLAQARAQNARVGTNTAPAAARARLSQQTQQGRVGTNTSSATQAAARITSRQNTPNAAASNAARIQNSKIQTATSGQSDPGKTPSAQASTLPKASMSGGGVNNPSGAGIAARKIEAPRREVSAAEIVKDKDYQSNLAKVGGEKAAKNLAVGTKLDNLPSLEKGQSIWSQTKDKLSRTAAPGFEAGNTKGGAGR